MLRGKRGRAGHRYTNKRQGESSLLHITTSRGETVVPLVEHDLRIGHVTENEFTIDSPAVDDLHARLVREGTSFRFHQPSESRPTLLNDKPVDAYPLQPEGHL